MVSLLVYIMLAIAVGTAASITFFQMWRSFELASLAQRNEARMEQLVGRMQSALRFDPGAPANIVGPLGDVDSLNGRMRLPQWVVGDDHTPWGARYGYCPMAAVAGGVGAGSANVGWDNGGGSHSVGIVDIPVSLGSTAFYPSLPANVPAAVVDGAQDHSYVVSSGLFTFGVTASGVAMTNESEKISGFIVSPAPWGVETPNCSDIAVRNGMYVISAATGPAGSVRPISALAGSGVAVSQWRQEFAVFVAPSDVGQGTGADVDDAMSFSRAHELWASFPPQSMTFYVAPGNYEPGFSDVDFHSAFAGRAVQFVGPESGSATFSISGSSFSWLIGVDFASQNVTFDSSLPVDVSAGARASFSGGSLGFLKLFGGSVSVDANNLGSAEVRSGELNLVNLTGASSTPAPSILATGGLLVVDGVQLSSVVQAGSSSSVLTSGQLILVDAARISFANGGGVGSQTSTLAAAVGATAGYSISDLVSGGNSGCSAVGADYVCVAWCNANAVHVNVKQGVCKGEEAALTGSSRVSLSSSAQGFLCRWTSPSATLDHSVQATCSINP